jgi:hypothetical protein
MGAIIAHSGMEPLEKRLAWTENQDKNNGNAARKAAYACFFQLLLLGIS